MAACVFRGSRLRTIRRSAPQVALRQPPQPSAAASLSGFAGFLSTDSVGCPRRLVSSGGRPASPPLRLGPWQAAARSFGSSSSHSHSPSCSNQVSPPPPCSDNPVDSPICPAAASPCNALPGFKCTADTGSPRPPQSPSSQSAPSAASAASPPDPRSCDGECWKCEAAQPVEAEIKCGKCGAIQRLTDDPDLFALFQVPCRARLDAECVKQRYRDLARQAHPDGWAGFSHEERQFAEHNSSVITTAYTRLLDPVARSAYLVESRYGIPFDEDTPVQDLEFLSDIMEAREEIDILTHAKDYERLGQILKTYTKRMEACIEEIDQLLAQNQPSEAHQRIVRLRYYQTIAQTCREALPSS